MPYPQLIIVSETPKDLLLALQEAIPVQASEAEEDELIEKPGSSWFDFRSVEQCF